MEWIEAEEKEFSVVGRSLPGIDAVKKAAGTAQFAGDLVLPGMTYGRVFRSTLSHARILKIDLSRALRLPGVITVATSADFPDERHGTGLKDQPIFARGKVRYIGESLAGVVAVDEDTAAEALELIKVDYEPLPAVFDPEEAMKPEAPIIHEELANYEVAYQVTRESMKGNVAYHGRITQGDVEKAFGQADYIFDDTFRTQKVHQCYLEPHSCLATFDIDGRVTVWTATQRPHSNQVIVAGLLRMPLSKVRVIGCLTGGAFGGKNRTLIEPVCVAMAQKARRPVKLVFTREEEFTSATSRHPCIIKIKAGVKSDGTILARKMRLIYDSGAYCMVPNAIWLGMVNGQGPYRIPNYQADAYAVYTNKSMAAAFRGFGAPQVAFAYESQMDMIAEKLSLDPVELRLKNGMETGDPLPTGQKVPSVRIKETLKAAAEIGGWKSKKEGSNRGKGVASCSFVCGGFVSASFVRLSEDGTAVVNTGGMDMGQGLRTAMAQIAAEELGILAEDVVVVNGDTDSSPFDIGIFGDRGTNTVGKAVQLAARDAKEQLFKRAAQALEANPEDLVARARKIYVKGSPDRALPIETFLKGSQYLKAGAVLGKASFTPDSRFPEPHVAQGAVTPFFQTASFDTQVAEVEVDPEIGTVKLLRLVCAHDCGKALNPIIVEGQMDGGLAIGAGYGVSEQIIYEQGQVMNPSFSEYRMLTAVDLPRLETHIVDGYDPSGPFGAKGVGNAPLIPTAPAIANAIYNVLGIRIKELPLTPDKVLKALEEKRKGG